MTTYTTTSSFTNVSNHLVLAGNGGVLVTGNNGYMPSGTIQIVESALAKVYGAMKNIKK